MDQGISRDDVAQFSQRWFLLWVCFGYLLLQRPHRRGLLLFPFLLILHQLYRIRNLGIAPHGHNEYKRKPDNGIRLFICVLGSECFFAGRAAFEKQPMQKQNLLIYFGKDFLFQVANWDSLLVMKLVNLHFAVTSPSNLPAAKPSFNAVISCFCFYAVGLLQCLPAISCKTSSWSFVFQPPSSLCQDSAPFNLDMKVESTPDCRNW